LFSAPEERNIGSKEAQGSGLRAQGREQLAVGIWQLRLAVSIYNKSEKSLCPYLKKQRGTRNPKLETKNIMNNKKSVLIIGAGIGGIATAAFLARKGFDVKVFEKNPFPGGRCGQIKRDGHRFDLGATILLMPSIYKSVFDSLGLKFEECFDLKPLPSVYKIHFGNGDHLTFCQENSLMQDQLETIENNSYSKFQKYIYTGYRFFQDALRNLLSRNFYHFSEFATLKNFLLLIRLKTYLNHYSYVRRFFKHPDLRKAFTFQNIYVGQSPFNAPALFSMLPAAELTEGTFFPVGGMFRIVEKLVKTGQDYGVQYYYNNSVVKIDIQERRAKSILLSDGTSISADIIIVNADLPYAYRKLLPDPKISSRIDAMKYACSAIVFHWGLDKVFPGFEHHSVFLSGEYRENLNMIFNEKSISDKPSFYIHAPSRTDPSSAPPDGDTLSVIVPVGHIDEKYDQDWDKIKSIARFAVINRLIEEGFKDIEKHIKFEICYPPRAWENIYNVSRGSVFGSLSHNVMQMGYFRPHNRHDLYRNLFFVGGSTHPGNGVPLVLLSAKLTSERIIAESDKL
jgi:phytoene desaturase